MDSPSPSLNLSIDKAAILGILDWQHKVHEMKFGKSRSSDPEIGVDIRNLVQRLSLSPEGQAVHIVAFISARSGEGTSTVARDYAIAQAAETGNRVLLIDAGLPIGSHQQHKNEMEEDYGLLDAVIAGQSVNDAIAAQDQGIFTARWMCCPENRAAGARLLHDPEFWKTLLASFDIIIIAAPALQTSFDGVILAAKADAVVMVVEAESTRQAVIEHLRDTLAAANAKIVGFVMNKRRYYIPNRVYKRM